MLAADLSAERGRALEWAIKLAQLCDARLVAVHMPSLGVAQGEKAPARPGSTRAHEPLADDVRRRVEARLAGMSHEILHRAGEAWPLVSALIEENRSGALILAGSFRAAADANHSPRGGAISPAEELFRRASCAVVTVGSHPGGHEETSASGQIERILYCTDFSVESLAAAPWAVSLASQAQAQLVLLYSDSTGRQNQTNAAQQTLRDLVPLGTRLASKPKCLVERGAPADVALRMAAAEGADLLVLGIPLAAAAAPAGQGDALTIAWGICREASCPVLTVRI